MKKLKWSDLSDEQQQFLLDNWRQPCAVLQGHFKEKFGLFIDKKVVATMLVARRHQEATNGNGQSSHQQPQRRAPAALLHPF